MEAAEFMAWAAREWNVVQDAYWWNTAALPTAHCAVGLMRPSVKPCVWLGPPDCYRNRDVVLWTVSQRSVRDAARARAEGGALDYSPSGAHMRRGRATQAAIDRGGATPYNLLPIANSDSVGSAGSAGHGAGTPEPLCAWWVRYLCPPGGLVLDPFAGVCSVGVAALEQGRRFVGIEQHAAYLAPGRARLAAAGRQTTLQMRGT